MRRQAAEADGLRIHLLGGFRVWVGDRRVPDADWRWRKPSAVVKLLALAPGHRLQRDRLIDLLWPDLAPEAAANNLRQALHVARRALEPPPASGSRFLRLQGDLVVLDAPGALWVDVEAFEAAVRAARQAQDPEAYRAALELYTGELLPEDRYEAWASARAEEVRTTYLAALRELARLHEQRGQPGQAIEALRRIVGAEPTDEAAQAALMRLYARTGQRHQALHQYQQLRSAL